MDVVAITLTILGAGISALAAIAYNKPKDYLALNPVMSYLAQIGLGATGGIWFATNAALTTLAPLIDSISGGPTAMSVSFTAHTYRLTREIPLWPRVNSRSLVIYASG